MPTPRPEPTPRAFPARLGPSRTKRLAAQIPALALVLALASLSEPARAASAQQELEQAEQAYANLEYPEANKFAERAARTRGLTHDQLVRTYKMLALTAAVLDKEQQARDAFIYLLTYDPDFQLDANLGPRVQTPFFEARGFWRAQPGKPGLEVASVLRPKEPGTLRVTTRDPSHVAKKIYVGYRWGGLEEMKVVPVQAGSDVAVEIPAPPSGVTRLDYYAQALDDRDDVVFEVGSPLAPKSTMLAAEPRGGAVTGGGGESKSVLSSPVFWIVTTVLVAGGVTAAVILTRPKETAVERPLPPTGSVLFPGLLCGGTTKCL